MMSFTLGLDKGVQLGRSDHPWHYIHKNKCTYFNHSYWVWCFYSVNMIIVCCGSGICGASRRVYACSKAELWRESSHTGCVSDSTSAVAVVCL